MTYEESDLSLLAYGELSDRLSSLSIGELVHLVNSKSVKVGDSAVSELLRRDQATAIFSAFEVGLLTTKFGKMRFCYVAGQDPTSARRSQSWLIQLVRDRSSEVADTALFTLVKCDISYAIDELNQIASEPKLSAERRSQITRAVDALVAKDPKRYSSNFGG